MSKLYTDNFYSEVQESAHDSAASVLKLLFRDLKCQSVVDLGCAQGEWLATCVRAGIEDVIGVDGEWVSVENLKFSRDKFVCQNLTIPLVLNRRFDLAISLEVAEHLSESESDTLVQSLVSHADAVLFSAAIPYQQGTHHVNCQWPKYWANKFAAHGYVASDCLRPQLWDMSQVALHYRQNVILYLSSNCLDSKRVGKNIIDHISDEPKSMVHPDYYMMIVGEMSHKIDMSHTLRQSTKNTLQSLGVRVSKLFGK